MYARAFIHSNNQIILLADPIDVELLYQLWTNIGYVCCYILGVIYNTLYTIWYSNYVNIPALWICIGVVMYNIYLVHLINQLNVAEEDIKVLKLNINRITNLFAHRDDHLDDYIKATEYELRSIKKEIYKYKNE
jgi:hypothetical protein